MKNIIRKTLYDSVYLYNVLPMTSQCNTSCVFCSHKQNPMGLEAYAIPALTREQLEELMVFLSPERKIVIGESATRIIEGEPFCHPDCLGVLRLLRDRFPSTLLQVTTNGILLTADMVKELKDMEPLEVNISLNSASVKYRKLLMNDNRPEQAAKAVEYMHRAGITFHGSIVPMLWLTGWDDIGETISYLEQKGSTTVRIFKPGFTRYLEKNLQPPIGWEEELDNFHASCRTAYDVPITLEPAGLKDLQPFITGIIKGSKADLAGVKAGQEILDIDGIFPFSRVDAFHRISLPGKHLINVKENGKNEKRVLLDLLPGEKSGLVMDYDLSVETVKEIVKLIKRSKARQTVVLGSEWGSGLLKLGLEKLADSDLYYDILPVPNLTFGGTIRSAGLLLVDDFQHALKSYLEKDRKPDLAVLPALAFDKNGRDLRGVPYHNLVEQYGLQIELV